MSEPGWIISLKNWSTPLYVRAELPERHISWTGSKDEAMRFHHRTRAYDFLMRLGELPDQCDIRFVHSTTAVNPDSLTGDAK